jgi:DNA-binding transcriptional LysR family regulator
MALNRHHLPDLSIFLLIVQFRSFRKVADHLDVTVSAVRHGMQA